MQMFYYRVFSCPRYIKIHFTYTYIHIYINIYVKKKINLDMIYSRVIVISFC